jgi:Fur family ferric uptake transcriptional regulator
MKMIFNKNADLSEDPLQKLKQAGYRVTKSRKSVVRTLQGAEGWLRPESILERARRRHPSLGLVTVYRTLNLLSELGCVRRVHFEDGCHGYAQSALSHSHHLVCKRCRQVVEFPGTDELEPLLQRLALKTGFIIEDHMLELLGVCPDCQSS